MVTVLRENRVRQTDLAITSNVSVESNYVLDHLQVNLIYEPVYSSTAIEAVDRLLQDEENDSVCNVTIIVIFIENEQPSH